MKCNKLKAEGEAENTVVNINVTLAYFFCTAMKKTAPFLFPEYKTDLIISSNNSQYASVSFLHLDTISVI